MSCFYKYQLLFFFFKEKKRKGLFNTKRSDVQTGFSSQNNKTFHIFVDHCGGLWDNTRVI